MPSEGLTPIERLKELFKAKLAARGIEVIYTTLHLPENGHSNMLFFTVRPTPKVILAQQATEHATEEISALEASLQAPSASLDETDPGLEGWFGK